MKVNTDNSATLVAPPLKEGDEFVAQPLKEKQESIFSLAKYLVVGTLFGIIFIKAEIISWFRIQEMFRLDSFHMYGVIGSAIAVGAISIFIIKRFKIKTLTGEQVKIAPKVFNQGQIYGGLTFRLGWALTGACPGPLFAQIGSGFLAVIVTLFSAIAGTWVYGALRTKLPH